MVRFSACDQATKDFAERFSIQNPAEGDVDATIVGSVTIPAGTRVTLDFNVEKGYTIHVKTAKVDYFINTNYKFLFREIAFEGDNEIPFSVPQKETEKVTIVIENFNIAPQTYTYQILGWASSR